MEAIKGGEFAEWIKEKLRLLFDNKEIDDILNADSIKKIIFFNKINNNLKKEGKGKSLKI